MKWIFENTLFVENFILVHLVGVIRFKVAIKKERMRGKFRSGSTGRHFPFRNWRTAIPVSASDSDIHLFSFYPFMPFLLFSLTFFIAIGPIQASTSHPLKAKGLDLKLEASTHFYLSIYFDRLNDRQSGRDATFMVRSDRYFFLAVVVAARANNGYHDLVAWSAKEVPNSDP